MACDLTLDHEMGGIFSPFHNKYEFEDGSGKYTLVYTSDLAGGTGPGCIEEGFTPNGECSSKASAEIFHSCSMGSCYWYLYSPFNDNWFNFDGFINGSDGCDGMMFGNSGEYKVYPISDGGGDETQSGNILISNDGIVQTNGIYLSTRL